MLQILVCLQYAFAGLIVFALTFLITVIPDTERARHAIQLGSLIWTLSFAVASAFLVSMYRSERNSHVFTIRWPALVAEAIWLLGAGVFVLGVLI